MAAVDLKAARKTILMILLALGLPALIFYNVFFSSSPPTSEIGDLKEVEQNLQQLEAEGYRLHSVQDDGGVLRINILLNEAPENEEETRMRTLSALYDVQGVIGKERTVSVWSGTPTAGDKLKLHGMAFFSSITENYTFKSASEIR